MFFFFNDTATTEIYTLSLHDALPIWRRLRYGHLAQDPGELARVCGRVPAELLRLRSEEHTSELQSHLNLVCRLLLEKKNHCCPTFCKAHTKAAPLPSTRRRPSPLNF